MDIEWHDVGFCWAWEADCRIDADLLEATGTWIGAAATAAVAWLSYSLSKRAHKQSEEAREILSATALTTLSFELFRMEALLAKGIEIAEDQSIAAGERLRRTSHMFSGLRQLSDQNRNLTQHLPKENAVDVGIAMAACETLTDFNTSIGKLVGRLDEARAADSVAQLTKQAKAVLGATQKFTGPIRDWLQSRADAQGE